MRQQHVMKRLLITFLLGSMVAALTVKAESYTSLWKQVDNAIQKDLPATQVEILCRIAEKAQTEKQYGHMLKALLMRADVSMQVCPDSAETEMTRLHNSERTVSDSVAVAVLRCALGRIYHNRAVGTNNAKDRKLFEQRSKDYYRLSMADIDLLGNVKAEEYKPLVVEEAYSRIFYNDLLHIIGYEAKAFKQMHDYYAATGNRYAQCVTALEMVRAQKGENEAEVKKSRYLQSLDSLITIYEDMKVAGELAVERYKCMENTNDATAAEKVQYINYSLSKWGGWPGLNYLRNAKTELERPSFNINAGDIMLLPETPRLVRVNSIRNISQLNLALYRTSLPGDTRLNPDDGKDLVQIQKHIVGTVVQNEQLRYVGRAPYEESADSLTLAPLPVGVYLLVVSTDNKDIAPQRCLLHVSDLFTISETLPGKKVRIAVVNATTGKPVSGAKVRLSTSQAWEKNSGVTETLTTGRNGEVVYQYTNRKPVRAYAYTNHDNACAEVSVAPEYYDPNPKDATKVVANTDRTLYRPGQTVHASAILWQADSHKQTAAPKVGEAVTFVLQNANYEEVERKTATTDEFGQAAADFTLPEVGLTGNCRISVQASRRCVKQIRVEKYKRPTFDIELEKPDNKYSAGDTITVEGTARTFSGMPVQGAKVSYTVTRRASWWWRPWNMPEETILSKDSAITDDSGHFRVRMPMVLPEQKNYSHMYFNIEAEATVTDGAGESHQSTVSIPLSNHTTVLTCDMPEKSLADSLGTITFGYMNIAGEKIAAKVSYTIDGKQLEANTNEATDIRALRLRSGQHSMTAICGEDTIRRQFVVFTLQDKKAPIETHDWFYQSSSNFPATIQVGSSDEEHHIYYTILTSGKMLESGIMEGHDCLHSRTFSYKEEYGDGIRITYAWVNRGKLYSHSATISRTEPDKVLRTEWKSFRDKLVPGQKETWTLTISRGDGTPADAQLLATIYDKSLDALQSHSLQTISNLFAHPMPWATWIGGSHATTGLYGFQDFKMLPEKHITLSHLDDKCFNIPYTFMRMMKMRAYSKQSAKLAAVEEGAQNITMDMAATALIGSIAGITEAQSDATGNGTQTDSKLRENFDETAFFAPDLRTDAKGNVELSFTLPESVTTWRLLALAHDREMNAGTIEAEAVASKSVMVQPNMPRFVREGDNATVVTRLLNTTDNTVTGVARMELIDAESQKVIETQSRNFSIAANATSEVAFGFTAREGMLICRITAAGKGFSDGEQHYLPVLTDKELVTNTHPFTQTGPGTYSVDIQQLAGKGQDRRVTVEYTNSPIWTVIQALPTVSDYRDNSAISLASAYYATVLASDILTSVPGIRETMESWKTDKVSLASNLQRNEDLRSIVLAETPWLAEANSESGQKMMLANYFNRNNLTYKLKTIYKTLSELQNEDGSFSWWKGMNGSTYITTEVATLLARLGKMAEGNNDTKDLLGKAMTFLRKAYDERVDAMRKEKSPQLANTDIDYLYLCTIAADNTSDNKAYTYLRNLLLKADRRTDIRTKAMTAIILGKDNSTAKEYVRSIKEFTVAKEGFGRYFDTPRAAYSWRDYKIPTHVAAIEAITAITPDDHECIDAMKLWLLQQKRTQAWDTPVNSVDAIHALMTDCKESIADGARTTIKVDGKTLDNTEPTSGAGYVRSTIDNAKARTVSFEKTGDGTSWGSVYVQELAARKDITDATAGLSIERNVDIPAGELKVGSKVKVTITVIADRDYDFVQIKDLRAACLEPVNQLSGYRNGCYVAPQDNCTTYFFDRMSKGKHTVETEYFVDREGTYHTGSCIVECAYSPEYTGRTKPITITTRK